MYTHAFKAFLAAQSSSGSLVVQLLVCRSVFWLSDFVKKFLFTRVQEEHLMLYNNISDSSDGSDSSDSSGSSDGSESNDSSDSSDTSDSEDKKK